MSELFKTFNLKNVSLRNRIVMPPMCMYSAGEDGLATEWHQFHYRTRAQGGAALIIQEATAVEPRGRISDRDLGIWNDDHIPALSAVVEGIKAEGAVPAIQLAHAGRKCTVLAEDIIAPSPLNFDESDKSYKTPREMNRNDIDEVVDSFRDAARRAGDAGYQVLEIHGAHGYLISEFLSPLTNRRTDDFGGSPEKRAELLRRVIRAVRTVWNKEKLLMVRVSGEDWKEGGNKAADIAAILNLVKEEGVDIIHVSTGGVDPDAVIPVGPAFQIPAAGTIREQTGLPVIGGGLVTDYERGEKILTDGDADLVFFGRELLRNPYFPLLSAKAKGIKTAYTPVQYERAL
ncbi:NADH:flavin oxidoreductase/NADH oxidase [Spirochaeta isovalerica]|uniref:NADPH2 dehydrogenase n=1 Tax=Spirochaeta isovalerica TaxID=150 RepID=A0A841R6C8_9SPIO|nr:NADH:flavin oxidoreductase/NADH oxidase [Spirochaeta isovalerica]MBB6479393.1 NADPH2 dehydrogenase [Spirochaeta isovalerica]